MEVFSTVTNEDTGKKTVIATTKSSQFFSRYNGLTYYYNELDDKYQLETRHWLREYTDNSKVTSYKVKKGDTYDTIALAFYNNPTLYWIICDYNRIIDPLKPPKADTILLLPSLNAGLEFERNDRWKYR